MTAASELQEVHIRWRARSWITDTTQWDWNPLDSYVKQMEWSAARAHSGEMRFCEMKSTNVCSQCRNDNPATKKLRIFSTKDGAMCFEQHTADVHAQKKTRKHLKRRYYSTYTAAVWVLNWLKASIITS
jgi:hypothetical protein